MHPSSADQPFRLGFFDTVQQADQAVRRLLVAGFSKKELAIICPEKCQGPFVSEIPRAEQPGSHAIKAMVEGGAIGAAIGGIALAAAAATTAGLALIPAAGTLIGGGAFAGAFSGLTVREGYGEEIGQYYEEAVRLGKIVVGVEVEGNDSAERLESAWLASAGPSVKGRHAPRRTDHDRPVGLMSVFARSTLRMLRARYCEVLC